MLTKISDHKVSLGHKALSEKDASPVCALECLLKKLSWIDSLSSTVNANHFQAACQKK